MAFDASWNRRGFCQLPRYGFPRLDIKPLRLHHAHARAVLVLYQ
jgi:hypothetical protein